MRRLAGVFLVTLAVAAPASAATTTWDRNGTLLIDGRPVFPVALLRPPLLEGRTPAGSDAWDEVVAAGVNLLAAGPFGADWSDSALTSAQVWNAAAAARGVHTWVNLRELARAQPGTSEEAKLRTVVETLKNDPALALWKGADEPLISGWPPSLLRHAYSLTRSLDPRHPSLLLHAPRGTARDLRPYRAVGDIHAVDPYPVTWRARPAKLHSVGEWTRRLRSFLSRRAVVTTLAICFSGSSDPTGTGLFVVPTKRQMRFMAYDAILNGARGLVFFGGHATNCHTGGDVALEWNWTYWERVLEPLVREIGPRGRLYGALLRPESGPDVRTRDPRVQVEARRVGSELWVIAARRDGPLRRVRITGLPRSLRRGWVYREGRTVRVRAGTLVDSFGPWAVHAYRFRLP